MISKGKCRGQRFCLSKGIEPQSPNSQPVVNLCDFYSNSKYFHPGLQNVNKKGNEYADAI